jgi:hypothetical protein
MATKIYHYREALEIAGNARKHILLGNGFSIDCDPIFHYGSLYEAAVAGGLSDRAQQVFHRLGTNNFEGAMRLLDDSHWIASIYELVNWQESEMLEDVQVIKETLLQAVAHSHLPNTASVPNEKKLAALEFLQDFYNVFTTNYDLLPYWVNMNSPNGPMWEDGFRTDPDEPDAPYVVFSRRIGNNRGMYFIHGALHLHVVDGELRKHCWERSGKALTQLIKEGLAERNYPLFVAEGNSNGKLEQIQRSGYLWYCLDKLARIQNTLFVFGHALGPSDQHIVDILANNTDLRTIAISMFGDPDTPSNQEIIASANRMRAAREEIIAKHRGRGHQLQVLFFDSQSASPWGVA